jgi:hypothetical protein
LWTSVDAKTPFDEDPQQMDLWELCPIEEKQFTNFAKLSIDLNMAQQYKCHVLVHRHPVKPDAKHLEAVTLRLHGFVKSKNLTTFGNWDGWGIIP